MHKARFVVYCRLLIFSFFFFFFLFSSPQHLQYIHIAILIEKQVALIEPFKRRHIAISKCDTMPCNPMRLIDTSRSFHFSFDFDPLCLICLFISLACFHILVFQLILHLISVSILHSLCLFCSCSCCDFMCNTF